MSETRIAARYARSLYSRAEDLKALDAVVSDMKQLNLIVAESKDFNVFLQSPLISKELKKNALDKIFSGFHAETRNLFRLMAEKSRESYISAMGNSFLQLYNQNNGITEAVVTTATEIDKDSLLQIENFVKSKTGAGSVEIVTKTDPSIIGGITIMFDGKIYDSSISSQLKKIKKELKIA